MCWHNVSVFRHNASVFRHKAYHLQAVFSDPKNARVIVVIIDSVIITLLSMNTLKLLFKDQNIALILLV